MASTTWAAPGLRDFRVQLADAYRRAALADVDMHRATSALEAIHATLAGRRTGLRALNMLDTQVALAEHDALQGLLVELREELKDEILAEQRQQLARLAEVGAEAAAVEWLQAYAAAFSFWRLEVCANLCQVDVEIGGELPSRDDFRRWTRFAIEERWAEAYELLFVLANCTELEAELRARFLINAAEVQMYHLLDMPEAERLLKRAHELGGESPLLEIGRAEYALESGDLAQARALLERAADSTERYEACKLLGDAAKRSEEYAEAERWYQAAIAHEPGSGGAYVQLAWLYGSRDGVADDQRLVSLIERAALVDPSGMYSAYVSLGELYDRGGAAEKAHDWYERAIALNPRRSGAHIARGYAFANAGRIDEAEQAFRTAIEAAPEAFDGYWGMAWLLEREMRYPDALRYYDESLQRRPAWRAIISSCQGRVMRLLGDIDEAEQVLLAALKEVPDSEPLFFELHELVTELSEERHEPHQALELLERVRTIMGAGYEANFLNRVGNIHFTHGNATLAANAYGESLAIEEDATVRRNLSAAYRELGQWEQAAGELERAVALDGDSDAHASATALLLNARGNGCFDNGDYEAARDLYERAVALAPNEPVMHSNVALAWSEIWRPDCRRISVDHARRALRRAIELNPLAEYHDRLAELESEARLLKAFGEPPWTDETMPRLLVIHVAVDLVPLIVEPGSEQLNDGTRALIEQVRSRLREISGLPMPAVRFVKGEACESGQYVIHLLDRVQESGWAPPRGRVWAGDADRLEALGITGSAFRLGWSGETAFWIDEDAQGRAEEAALDLWHPIEVPLRHLESVLEPAFEQSASLHRS